MTTSMLSPTSFCILLLCSYFGGAIGELIDLENNGAVTIDTPITFTIKNNYQTINPLFQYRISFGEFPEYDAIINTSNRELTYNVTLPSPKAKEGYHDVYLQVWDFFGAPYLIGNVLSSFYLEESIVGFVNASQDIDRTHLENLFISTKLPVSLSAVVYDPSSFFESANITYKWIVNGSPLEGSYDKFISCNFTQPQLNNISLAISIVKTNFQKSGLFEVSLESKDPIHNLTADGDTNVQLGRNESLQLNIKIDGGTPPFSYCWEITNSTTLGKICNSTNESFFSITRYFMERGNKTLIISVENDVSSLTKNMTILINETMVQGEKVSPCYVKGATGSCIYLSDNGPVTIDTPITFTVKNSYRTIEPSYEYRFKFDQYPQHDKTIVSTSGEVFYSVIFESSAAPYSHYYRVYLDVWYCHLGKPVSSIGAAYQSFILLDSLVGFIDVSQDIDEESLVNNFVSTTSPVNLTAKIHDPSGFFASVNITYKWIVNGSPQEESYDQFIIQNFTQPQINNISVIVSATTLQKSGLFEISLQSKDPIQNLTADGHTSVELGRNESLQLNIKIDGGTPPFFYCWEITNSTTLGKICNSTNESFFSITRYFMERGNKTLIISVENDVSSLTKNMTILINEIQYGTYVSFILVPVCSIIIAIFIIIMGIVFHMKHKRQLTIKVARFALQSIDEKMERTFWGRIRDSLTQ